MLWAELPPLVRRVRFALDRWWGFCLTILLILCCGNVMVVYVHSVVLIRSPTLLDVFLTLLSILALLLALWSLCLASLVKSGAPPPWITEARVEEFVRGVLTSVMCHGDLDDTDAAATHVGGAGHHHITEAERQETPIWRQCANDTSVLSQQQQQQQQHYCRRQGDDPNDAPVVLDMLTEEDTVREEEQERQRQTVGFGDNCHPCLHQRGMQVSSSQIWMPHQNLHLVAADALTALDRSPESFEQEMTFLLGGAGRCLFCRIYKLDETHHCSTCRTCVHQMDHHCPWIGQCVGHGNHKYSLLLVGYLALATLVVAVQTIVASRDERIRSLWLGSSHVFLFFVTFISCLGPLLLLYFLESMWLVARGDSTLQLMRREERSLQEQRRHGAYAMVVEEEEGRSRERWLDLQNMRRVFGTGAVFPFWFLPVIPQRPSLQAQEAAFWEAQRVIVLQQLLKLLDVGTDDDEDREDEF